jgi:hypothetical protein
MDVSKIGCKSIVAGIQLKIYAMDGQKKNEPDIVIVNVPQVSLHV